MSGLLLGALPFLDKRMAMFVGRRLDTFGGIPLGGIHPSLGVESDVLGFFPAPVATARGGVAAERPPDAASRWVASPDLSRHP